MIEFHLEWSTYYPSSITPIHVKNSSSYTISSNQNVYFTESVVIGLSNKVIYYSNSNSKLLIESCKFEEISSLGEGGTIYFVSSGEFVHNKICANQCKMTSYNDGVYSYTQVTNDASSKNYVIESSIAKSTSQSGGETFLHHYGDLKVSKTNITDTDIGYIPCVYLVTGSNYSEISYSTFKNNNGHNSNGCSYCIGSQMHKYSFCDILSNTCPQEGIFYCQSNIECSSCNMINNVASTGYLFYMYSGTVTTSSCYINNPRANSNYPSKSLITLQNSLAPQVIIIGCNDFIKRIPNNCFASCNSYYYSDKTIYKIIAVLIE